MRRVLPLLVAVLVVLATPPLRASAEQATDADAPHDIVFPVIGDVSYTDTFGETRPGGRTHEGQDLLGTKMQELVAADSGTVTYLTWPEASYGYYLRVTADDGWVYSYVHINNDTPGTDDGAASRDDVYGPGIEAGARVERGQLLGFLGDSGNAEEVTPHLHFEMHAPDGTVVNPMASLDAAQRLDAPVGATLEPSPIPRLAGEDRVATAIEVSKKGWPDGASAAVLSDGDSYAESLPASVLAGALRGPLLLERGGELSDSLVGEIDRLSVASITTIGSVPESIDAELRTRGIDVHHVGVANDPVATATSIAAEVGGTSGVAVLVNRSRFADGVSAAALAAGHGWPVLLTNSDLIPQPTVDAWRALRVTRIVLVGGTGVIGQNIETFVADRGRCADQPGCVVERVAGIDRYATSVDAAERSVEAGDRTVQRVLLGTGTNYPDTLASGPLAARFDGIALLVDGSGHGDDDASRAFLESNADDVDDVAILGGPGAVSSAADRAIQEALGIS